MNVHSRNLLLVVYCLVTFSACVKEPVDFLPENGELYKVTLSMDLPESNPSGNTMTRSVSEENEFKLEDIYLLLFNTDGYVDCYPGKNLADHASDISRKTCTAELPKGTYDILIIGNCGAILSAAGLQEGQSRQEVAETLIYQVNGAWGYTDATFTPFPIYGEVLNVTLDSDKELTDIPVVRMVAWIDVKLGSGFSPTQDGYLRSVHLYNPNTQGQLIPTTGNYTHDAQQNTLVVHTPSVPATSASAGPLVYTPDGTTATELVYTIYTPEAVMGTTDYLKNTCLVVGIGGKVGSGATRAGLADSTYYYRIDFMDSNENFIPLLRNYCYTVTIEGISNAGFPDPDKAYRSEPYGLSYEVVEWEMYPMNMGYDPEVYRLDISQTYFEPNSITYSLSVEMSITHPDGWSAYPSSSPDQIEQSEYLSLKVAYDERVWETLELSYIHYPNADGYIVDMVAGFTFLLEIDVGNPGWNGLYPEGEPNVVVEYIHIVSGNLTNVISVKMTGRILL